MKNNDSLQHVGIKGMRWGIRRYQNKDGSLTPAGKKRYGVESVQEDEEKTIAETKKAVINSGDIRKVKAYEKELTTEELRKALERVDLNRRLNDLDQKYREGQVGKVTDTIDKVRQNTQKMVDAYNLAAKINNTFNKDRQMRVIDGQYIDFAKEYADKLAKSETIAANKRAAEANAAIKEEELRQKREKKQ